MPDPLRPARGVINGLAVAVIFWAVIGTAAMLVIVL